MDYAARLIANIQDALRTDATAIVRRAAIVRRVATVAGHRFEETTLTGPTKCSQCNTVIWGLWGQQCETCKLMAHRKCLQTIEATCTHDPKLLSCHKIERKTYLTPTLCDHCGTLLKGFIEQGVWCSSCTRSVHHDCEQAHFAARTCKPRQQGANDSEPDPYTHQSHLQIEDFEIVRLLGTGSFSKVYLAKLHHDDQVEEVAIKVVKKTNPVINSDPQSVFTEWRALNLGRSYPFLTIGHCCFQSRDRLFFVMEHVVGRDLVYHLTKDRRFTEYRAKFYAAEIVLALSYLHSQRVVYRDLKLDNVILTRQGHCKLLDFGMSKILGPERMLTRTFCGTPAYMSPEILRGDPYDYSTDWWSLGVLLFELLTGFSPFEAQTEEATYEAIRHADPDIPAGLSCRARLVLEGLLTKEPQRRLGCQLMEGGPRAIREHPFFKFKLNVGNQGEEEEAFQWEELERKQIRPPAHSRDYEHEVDKRWLASETVELTPINPRELGDVSQSDFEKFSFYSESFEDLAGL